MQIENEITHFNLVLLQLLLFDGHIISKCTKSTQNIVSFLSHADSNWEAPVIMIKFILIQCNHSLYQMDKIHHILGWERVEWMQMETYHRTAQNNRIASFCEYNGIQFDDPFQHIIVIR
eukprot:203920_1